MCYWPHLSGSYPPVPIPALQPFPHCSLTAPMTTQQCLGATLWHFCIPGLSLFPSGPTGKGSVVQNGHRIARKQLCELAAPSAMGSPHDFLKSRCPSSSVWPWFLCISTSPKPQCCSDLTVSLQDRCNMFLLCYSHQHLPFFYYIAQQATYNPLSHPSQLPHQHRAYGDFPHYVAGSCRTWCQMMPLQAQSFSSSALE